MTPNVTELLYVSREVAWEPWAVQYFFLIGLSFGSLFLSFPGLLLGRTGWLRVGRLALVGSLSSGIVGPVALLSDLNQPGRFLNFFLHPQTTSWMSRGSFILLFYVAALIFYAWAVSRAECREMGRRSGRWAFCYRLLGAGPVWPWLHRLAAVAAALGACLVAIYTGQEVMAVAARPLWSTPLLPLQFFATAVVGAIGFALILNRLAGSVDWSAEKRLNICLLCALGGVAAIGLMWVLAAVLGWDRSAPAALSELAATWAWRETALWAILATLCPVLLIWRRPTVSGWMTGAIALHSAWMFRWTVFIGGQTIPKTGAGFYRYHLPLGSDGLLGIVGTAGLWLAVIIALLAVLPWVSGDDPDLEQLGPQGA